MPNVRISDLPLATLPLDPLTSFFEVQAIEGGEDVSRRVATDDISISITSIVGTGVVDPSTALPYDYDAELTFENANALQTARLGWDGASTLKLESLAFGANLQLVTRSPAGVEQVAFVYSSSNDVTQIGQNAIHIDGNGDIDFEYDILGGNTGNLMILRQFDLQIIDQATSTSGRLVFSQGSFIITERGHIGLDTDGVFRMHSQLSSGPAIRARSSGVDWDVLDVDTGQGELRLYQIVGATRTLSLSTQPTGIRVHGDGTNDPVTPGLTQNASVQLRNASDEIVGFLGYATTDFLLTANQRGAELIFRATDDAGVQPVLFQADPNVNTQLGHGPSNAFVARTETAANGGLEVNNTATGAGFERVLTTADLSAGISFPIDAADNDQIRWGTGQDMLQFFDGTDMQFNAVDGVDFRFLGGTAGAEVMLTLIANGAVEIPFDGTVRLATKSTGADVTGTELDVINSANTLVTFKVFNSVGGIAMFSQATSGDAALGQLDGSGVITDRWMNFFLDGAVEQFFNATRRSATTGLGFDTFGTLFQLDNSSAATAADIRARNSEGGTLFRSDGGTLSIWQTDNLGALENLILQTSNNDATRLYFNGLLRMQVSSGGLDVTTTAGGNACVVDIHGTGVNQDASVRMRADAGGVQLLWDESATAGLLRQVSAVGGIEDTWISMVQNGQVELFNNGAGVARTITAANGGLEANNALTGGGYERVLTTSDLAASDIGLSDTRTSAVGLTTATLTNILTVTPEVNHNYFVHAQLNISSPAADNAVVDFTLHNDNIFEGTLTNSDDSTTTAFDAQFGDVSTSDVAVNTDGSAQPDGSYVTIEGILKVGANTAAFVLRAAKGADTGADGTVGANGSYLILIPINQD